MDPTLTQPGPATQGIDPKYITLAKSIRQVESGGNPTAVGKSGEFGAYQFEPATWAAEAPKFGVNVPLQQATLEQQNQVAVNQLAEWGKQHPDWNIGNFASAWNAGAGKPNAYLEGNVGTNSQGVSYDTPAYAKNVATAYQQFKSQSSPLAAPSTDTGSVSTAAQAPLNPSLGGFAQNVLQSGANFVGNLGEAALHPIQTIQNVGGAAVGGLQELGGQKNDNTQNFDNVINYFKQRYGGVDNLAHTLYTDPVGLAADLSAVLDGGSTAVGALGKLGDLTEAGRLGTAADLARESGNGADFIAHPNGTMMPTAGVSNPVTSTARGISNALGTAGNLVNPLTPVIAGAGALLGDGAKLSSGVANAVTGIPARTLEDIYRNPSDYTPEQIATVTRTSVGKEVESVLQDMIAKKSETGSGYSDIRAAETPINVTHDFLENTLRDIAKVDVKDGKIIATGDSVVRDSADVRELQNVFDRYKPYFQEGKLTPNQFLNLRSDLAEASNFNKGVTKSVEAVASKVRGALNDTYRSQIQGLSERDTEFSAQSAELAKLRKGFVDKDGNLTQTAINKIANAGNKDIELQRLERLIPGITRRIQVMRSIEDIQKAMAGHGGFVGKLAEGGAFITGLTTGNIPLISGSLATAIIASPQVAVPLLRVFGSNKALMSSIIAKLSRYATTGAVANAASKNQAPQEQGNTTQPQGTDQQTGSTTTPSVPVSQGTPGQNSSSTGQNQTLEDMAKTNNFDLEAARKEGYSDQEIQDYLSGAANAVK